MLSLEQVIVLLIIPLSIGVGVLLTLFGPLLLTRLRGSRYSGTMLSSDDAHSR